MIVYVILQGACKPQNTDKNILFVLCNMHGMCYWYLTRRLFIYIWTCRGATNSGQALWKILMVAIKLELTCVCCQYELAGTNNQSQQWYLPGESKCTPVWCHTLCVWQSKRTIATNEKSKCSTTNKIHKYHVAWYSICSDVCSFSECSWKYLLYITHADSRHCFPS